MALGEPNLAQTRLQPGSLAGECSGRLLSCVTQPHRLCWTDMQSSFGSGRVDRFSDAWHLCVLADTRCRSELWESEFRRQSQFRGTNPELSAFVPSRPWNSVIRATSTDLDFWKEELEDKIVDFRNVSWCIDRITRAKERGREGGAHPVWGQDGRYRTTSTGTQVCFAFNRATNGCHCLPHEPRTCLRVLPGATQNCRVSSAPRLDSTSQRCGEGQRQGQG